MPGPGGQVIYLPASAGGDVGSTLGRAAGVTLNVLLARQEARKKRAREDLAIILSMPDEAARNEALLEMERRGDLQLTGYPIPPVTRTTGSGETEVVTKPTWWERLLQGRKLPTDYEELRTAPERVKQFPSLPTVEGQRAALIEAIRTGKRKVSSTDLGTQLALGITSPYVVAEREAGEEKERVWREEVEIPARTKQVEIAKQATVEAAKISANANMYNALRDYVEGLTGDVLTGIQRGTTLMQKLAVSRTPSPASKAASALFRGTAATRPEMEALRTELETASGVKWRVVDVPDPKISVTEKAKLFVVNGILRDRLKFPVSRVAPTFMVLPEEMTEQLKKLDVYKLAGKVLVPSTEQMRKDWLRQEAKECTDPKRKKALQDTWAEYFPDETCPF